MMSRRLVQVLAVLLVVAATGCGLKGALTLPEKSSNVVIRGQTTATPTDGSAAPAPAPAPAEAPAKPAEEPKLPPPDLPHSNSGSSR